MMNPINKTSIKIHAFHSCKTSLLLPNESSVIETNKIFLSILCLITYVVLKDISNVLD